MASEESIVQHPVFGVAVGGGSTALLQFGLAQVKPDGTGGMKDKVAKYANTIGLGVGLLPSIVFLFMKEKGVAGLSALSSVLAGGPNVISELRGHSAAAQAAAAALAAQQAAAAQKAAQTQTQPGATPTSGFVATQRGMGNFVAGRPGFGAPPTMRVLGNRPQNVQILGPTNALQASQQQQANVPMFHPAFGGSAF